MDLDFYYGFGSGAEQIQPISAPLPSLSLSEARKTACEEGIKFIMKSLYTRPKAVQYGFQYQGYKEIGC